MKSAGKRPMAAHKMIYLNNAFVREDEGCLSPASRALLYGDGFFETMRSYEGRVFALAAHYERLLATSRFLKIPLPFEAGELASLLAELLQLNALLEGDSRIRLTLVRGRGAAGLFPDEAVEPEVIISAETVPASIGRVQKEGIALCLITGLHIDERSLLARHKTINYIPGIVGLMEVRAKGGDEGLFLNHEGRIAEGTTSNLFAVKSGVVMTPPLTAGILPGITRETAITVARSMKIEVAERDLTPGDLFEADEIFITSSVREIVPVVSFEGRPCPVGAVTQSLQSGYKRFVRDYFLK